MAPKKKVITINISRSTHPGWRESCCLSVCAGTENTPVYIPQRERDVSPAHTEVTGSLLHSERRVQLRNAFLPPATHRPTPERSIQISVKKKWIFTKHTECPSPRDEHGDVSLFSLSSRTSATWIRLKMSRTGSESSRRSTCWKKKWRRASV